jgi:hypothetical protein
VEIVSLLSYLYNEYYLWVGSLYLGKTFLVPLVVVIMLLSVVGLWVRQKFLCRDCGKYFLGDASYHHHSRKLREEALRMYANGMSMRAISRLNVPLGTVFTALW